MRIPRSIVLLAVGVIAGATIVTGVAVSLTAGASGSSITYYACLKSGRLTHVGGTAPTCSSTATPISWSSVGPQGPPGTNGSNGTNGIAYTCTAVPYPGIDLADCNLSGANLTNANFTGANLTDTDLTNANMTNANVDGANMSGADLHGVSSGGIVGTPSVFPNDGNWELIDGYFIGIIVSGTPLTTTGQNFSGINLTGVNLSFANFIGDNLTGANLSNTQLPLAYLTSANLTDANLAGVTFGSEEPVISGAIWSNTTCPDTTNSDADGGTCVGHGF